MSSCLLSYLGGVFDRVAAISCGSDTVTNPVMSWIINSTSYYYQTMYLIVGVCTRSNSTPKVIII